MQSVTARASGLRCVLGGGGDGWSGASRLASHVRESSSFGGGGVVMRAPVLLSIPSHPPPLASRVGRGYASPPHKGPTRKRNQKASSNALGARFDNPQLANNVVGSRSRRSARHQVEPFRRPTAIPLDPAPPRRQRARIDFAFSKIRSFVSDLAQALTAPENAQGPVRTNRTK